MAEISIIVPVYKVEKYLDRCVGSLVQQTFSDIEIILVDDGSPDGCPKMCDAWAAKDARIRVVHKQNAGLGFARNSGLDVATGRYIGFVDSDDYVRADMFEQLHAAAVKENADLAMCGFCCIGGIMTARADDVQEINCFARYTVFRGKEGVDQLMLEVSGARPEEKQDSRYGFSSVKNLYSAALLREHGIRFLSEREVASEDVFFLLDVLDHTGCAVGVPGAYYCYCRNGESLSKSYRQDRFEKCAVILDGIEAHLAQRMPASRYKLYTDRLFQAYARAACMQEIQFASANGLDRRTLNRRLRDICRDPRLQNTLRHYPWYRLPPTQAAFALTMRFSLIGLQKLLVRLKNGG